jgi:hypothetical protein
VGLVVSTVTARAQVHRRRGRGADNAETTDPYLAGIYTPIGSPRPTLGTCSLGICGPQKVPNFELISVDNHRIVAAQSALFLVADRI